MKHITYAMMLMGTLLTAASCSEDALFEAPQTEHAVQGKEVTITVGLPESEAHSRVAYDDTTLKLTWQEGDQLIVCEYKTTTDTNGAATTTVTQKDFTLQTGEGTTQATFTGTLDETAAYYKVFYKTTNLTIDAQGVPTFSYTNQVQTSADPAAQTAHLKDNLYLSSDLTTGEQKLTKEDIKGNNFVLTAHSSIFRFNIDSYKTEVGNLHTLIWTSNKKTTPASVSLKLEGEAAKAKKLNAYIAFDPATMKLTAGQPITLAFIGDNAIYLAEANSTGGKEYQPGYRYNAKVSTTSSTDALSTWIPVVPDDTKAQVLITTTDGKLPDTKPKFDNETPIPGTNSWLLSYNDANTALTEDFRRNSNLLAVYFSNKFTSIPRYYFYKCKSIVSVNLPNATTIGEWAFSESGIKTIELPSSLTTLNAACIFLGCKNLTTVTANGVKEIIGESIFDGCTALKNVNLPNAETITNYAFQFCTALEKIDLPSAIKIGNNVFKSCTALKKITLPKVTTIGANAFNQCGLTDITLPKVETIGERTFEECAQLKTLNIPSTKLKELPASLCRYCTNLTTVSGCTNVTTINESTFSECTALKTIDLPAVTTIKETAFEDSGLKSINLPKVTSLGSHVFLNCKNLETLHIGSQLQEIPLSLCNGCNNLKTVEGCKGVKTINKYAFGDCTNLTTFAPLEIKPSVLTTVDEGAFTNCTALSTPLPLTVTQMGDGIISGTGITEFTIFPELTLTGAWGSPIRSATQLKKLTVTTNDETKTEFIWDKDVSQIELYLLKDWENKTDAQYKPDFTAKKWYNRIWKSITLIDANGKPVPSDESGDTTLPDVGDGGSLL